MTVILELEDEAGNIDLCECSIKDTRVLNVIKRIYTAPRVDTPTDFDHYQAQYAHACGYHD